MLLNQCNFTINLLNEICYLNFYNLIASFICIICSIFIGLLLYFKIKNVCNDLLYLHNLRSSLLICLIFMHICELAETCLEPLNYINYVAPPLGFITAILSIFGTITLIGFIRLIEIRNKPICLYLVVLIEIILIVPKLWKYIKLTEDMEIFDLQPLILLVSFIILSLLGVTDIFSIYKETHSSKCLRSSLLTNNNVGYKHPHSTFLSKLTFWWLNPLLWKGYCEPLELEDLGNLYEENTSRYQYDQFLFIYQSFKNKQTSLWLCYFKSCWKMFTLGGLLKLLGDFVVLIGPLSISRIVDYIEINMKNVTNIENVTTTVTTLLQTTTISTLLEFVPTTPINITNNVNADNSIIFYPCWSQYLSNGWIIGVFVLISSILQGTLSQASTHIINMVGIKLKTAIQGLIYRKTLLISSSCFFNNYNNSANTNNNYNNNIININNDTDDQNKKVKVNHNNKQHEQQQQIKVETENNADAGTITNLMSEDAFNVMSFFWIAHYVWAIPLKITLVMYLLYQILGISAIIGSLVCIITMIPLQFFIGKIMSKNSTNASECTDERLRKLNEILLGIKIIKLNAWEKVFKERISETRSKELKKLDLDSFYWAAITILTHVSSVLITFVTLAVFINIENGDNDDNMKFTAGRIFSALALFNQLTVPLFIFPITVPIIIGAIISTKRLEQFLRQPEVRKEFEGVQNMARILCRSDASLDIFETEQIINNDNLNKTIKTTIKIKNKNDAVVDDNLPFSGNYNKNNFELNYELISNPVPSITTSTSVNDNNSITSSIGTSLNDISRRSSTVITQNQPNLKIKLKKKNELSKISQLERNRNKKTSLTSRDSLQLTLSDDHIVTIENCKFSWHNQLDTVVLKCDKLDIPKGKLTIIVGKTGSGKSTLLAALLKEMNMISGSFQWNKYSTTAYVPQNPWLLNATIRDNILFGESFRPKRYDRILEACALKPDIDLMPGGDMTEIGERGINLSGGQRQRIALARALYSSANVVIMDDALSALDNEVGQFIFDNTIKKMLLRYRRTTILVTQKLSLINNADYIIAMENNNVRACGTLSEIENNDPKLTQEWNSIMAKESLKEMQLSPGRTARERWKLFKNISRLGLQRGTGAEEEDLSSSQILYVPVKRRSSIYGSRHLTCDIPLPIDECHNEDLELRRHSASKRNPFIMPFEFDNHKSVLRVNSLQVTSKNQDRLPVIRNVSSPTGLSYAKKRPDIDGLTENKIGFRQFLRRLSIRNNTSNTINTNSVIYRERKKSHRPMSASSNSIQSINEEQHAPVKKLISTVSRYSEETEDEITDYNEEISTRYMSDEERKYGKIPTGIYRIYLKSCGLHIVFIFCLSAFGWQGLRVYTDIWLKNWTDDEQTNDVFYYFKIYGILSGVCMLLSLISTPAGQLGGSRARRIIHEKLVDSVLKKSLHFFQITPIGRILNRFSNDMSVIDKKVAATSQRLLQFILLCLCAILINTAITPWFLLLTIPICAIYYVIQRFYRSSSRELQRIENITNSPIISHFSETIQGVTTIRAFNQESRFMELLFKQMEANNIALIILNTSNRWLGIALDYLGGVIVFIAILTALSTSKYYPNNAIPSLIGLAINYTLLVPIYLNWVVKLLSDMEMYIGAVERIQCFIESGNKENHILYKSVPISWPQRGNIVFNNVSLCYENQKENVIKNLNLNIPAGQKLGICGRTGSCKSSFVLSLFGVLNITDGCIYIDDIDISSIHVDELRSRLSIIPQDVVLFGGTIRENLDPRRHYTDLELWNCLETAQLKDTISSLPTGLDTEIIEGGSNLSAGQRQLFCLARAVLKGSACLILDEATSSLDTTTEIELIKAANKAFEGRTIITIAHRVSTLLDYDRVIVFDNGQIVEDGDPQILKTKTTGRFSAMLKATTMK